MLDEVIRELCKSHELRDQIVHREELPAQTAAFGAPEGSLPPALDGVLERLTYRKKFQRFDAAAVDVTQRFSGH